MGRGTSHTLCGLLIYSGGVCIIEKFNSDDISVDSITVDNAIRPACNLNKNAILLVSNPANDTASTEKGVLSNISSCGVGSWKLTLLDSSRNGFSANVEGEASVIAGDRIRVSYSGAQTGKDEYVIALLCDADGDAICWGTLAQNSESGTEWLSVPRDVSPGTYTLKVFSEHRSGNYKSDYTSEPQEITLNVTPPREYTPQATFTATGSNSGILHNVGPGMQYCVDGGHYWYNITSDNMEISGINADALFVVDVKKLGDGITTVDSAAQRIVVSQAEAPSPVGVDCTNHEQNDGQITNIDATMEYRNSDNAEWADIGGTALMGLSPGTYEVHVKASGLILASPSVAVTIGEHTCVGQGDWSYDVNDHWKLCTCGAKVDESAHSGGETTCMSPATCAVCGQLYGEKDPSNHAGEIEWAQTPYNHSGTYGCCGVTVEDEPHEWIEGTCSVCGYACQHEGGKAPCTEHAMCDICGIQYGELDPNNHKASSEWTQEDDRHYHVCEYGCGTHLDEAMCSGGEATCTSPATCEVCGQPYGEIDALHHTNFVKIEGKPATHFAEGNIEYWYCDGCKKYYSDETCVYEISYELTILPMIEHAPDGTGWHFDANNHWQTCECGAKLDMAAHNFSWVIDSEATTTEPGSKHEECTMCGYEKASVEIPATGAGDGGRLRRRW